MQMYIERKGYQLEKCFELLIIEILMFSVVVLHLLLSGQIVFSVSLTVQERCS